MFSGIITHLATIKKISPNKNSDLSLQISLPQNQIKRKLEIGCSIAINGICLTLTSKKETGKNLLLSFQISEETLDKTNAKFWKVADLVNVEFSLRVGDELGGHMVLGHVDGCAKTVQIKKSKSSNVVTFLADSSLKKFITKKGSITLNGASLTVNNVRDEAAGGVLFDVNLIHHTINITNFKNLKIGDVVNLEIDLLARYLENLSHG